MSVYILSDLHIIGEQDPVYRSLLCLIQERVHSGDHLVLAGDVFDLFVGNKKIFKDRYAEFLTHLRKSAQEGAFIHYIEGNHDFQLRKVFEEIPGVKVYEDEVEIHCLGKRFHISHGDLADPHDYSYRALRWLLRSLPIRSLITLIPGHWIDRIGQAWSRKSRDSKPVLFAHLPLERQEMLRKAYRNAAAVKIAAGFDYVIMGHCHDLDEKFFQMGDRRGQYINVGFPRVHGSFLFWSSDPHSQNAPILRERLPGFLFKG